MKIQQAPPAIKLLLSIAFSIGALGQAPIKILESFRLPLFVISIVILFIAFILIKKFKRSFVPHSVIAISLVFIGGWVLNHLGTLPFALIAGYLIIWGGICYSIVAVGIYLKELFILGK